MTADPQMADEPPQLLTQAGEGCDCCRLAITKTNSIRIGGHNTQTNLGVNATTLPSPDGVMHNLPPVSAVFEGRDLAGCCWSAGRTTEAIRIEDEVLGPAHPQTASALRPPHAWRKAHGKPAAHGTGRRSSRIDQGVKMPGRRRPCPRRG
jgi:hypothetical protein